MTIVHLSRAIDANVRAELRAQCAGGLIRCRPSFLIAEAFANYALGISIMTTRVSVTTKQQDTVINDLRCRTASTPPVFFFIAAHRGHVATPARCIATPALHFNHAVNHFAEQIAHFMH